MKKVIIYIVLCLLIVSGNCFAAHIGSMDKPVEQGKWKIGIFNDNVQSSKFKVRTGAGSITLLTGAKIDESSTVGLEAAYGFIDNLSIFFRGGFSDRTLRTEWDDGSVTEMEYDQSKFWGYGLRYVVGSREDIMIAFNAQVAIQAGDEVESVRENGVSPSVIYEPGEGKLTEIQGSVLFGINFDLSKDMDLMPYLGLTANNSKLKSDNLRYRVGLTDYDIGKLELKESNRFGFVAGANLALGERFSLNIEGRFKTETAVSAGISYSF